MNPELMKMTTDALPSRRYEFVMRSGGNEQEIRKESSPLQHSPQHPEITQKRQVYIPSQSPVRDRSPVRYSGASRIIYDQRNNPNIRYSSSQQSPNTHVTVKPLTTTYNPITVTKPHEISHLSQQTVPKVEYDRCVSQCKNWQTKYNELYLKFMNLSVGGGSEENEALREENMKLRDQVQDMERRQTIMRETMEQSFMSLVKKYEQTTLQECNLLLDRFQLQSRAKY